MQPAALSLFGHGNMLFDDERIAYILKRLLKAQKEENTAIPILKEQLSNAEKSIANLISAIEQRVFTSSTKARLEELEDTKSKLEISILKEQIGNPCLSEDEITCWLHKYRELDMTKQTHRQKLVDSFVNSIYLYDDKIVLLYNGSEEAKTITFAELNRCSDTASASPPIKIPRRSRGYFRCGHSPLLLAVPKGTYAVCHLRKIVTCYP